MDEEKSEVAERTLAVGVTEIAGRQKREEDDEEESEEGKVGVSLNDCQGFPL